MKSKATVTENWCYDALRQIRWPNGITCPHCRRRRITIHSKFVTTSRRRYLCLGCRRTFTDLTGTPFARTNLPLRKWFYCLDLIERGIAITALSKKLRVKWDTTAYMLRRLANMHPGIIQKLRELAKEVPFA
ncbi:MAG: transposase [Alphaproteobacteria bacterium]